MDYVAVVREKPTARQLPRAADWIEAETASHLAAAGAVAQAGAGTLLLAVGISELLLGVWAAGWWQRSTVVLVAFVGAAALVRALAALVPRASHGVL